MMAIAMQITTYSFVPNPKKLRQIQDGDALRKFFNAHIAGVRTLRGGECRIWLAGQVYKLTPKKEKHEHPGMPKFSGREKVVHASGEKIIGVPIVTASNYRGHDKRRTDEISVKYAVHCIGEHGWGKAIVIESLLNANTDFSRDGEFCRKNLSTMKIKITAFGIDGEILTGEKRLDRQRNCFFFTTNGILYFSDGAASIEYNRELQDPEITVVREVGHTKTHKSKKVAARVLD